MENIEEKLNKIIELVKFIKNDLSLIPIIGNQPYIGPSTVTCNCSGHKAGESTGGWYCPVHGQCF